MMNSLFTSLELLGYVFCFFDYVKKSVQLSSKPIKVDFLLSLDMLSRAIRAPVGQLSRRRAGYAPFTVSILLSKPKTQKMNYRDNSTPTHQRRSTTARVTSPARPFSPWASPFSWPPSTTWSSVITCTIHTACPHLTSTWVRYFLNQRFFSSLKTYYN